MDIERPHLTGLDARIAERIAPTLADLGFEIVRVSVLGRETPTIQIMADRDNGTLISIEDCEQISHAVGAVLDVDDPIPGAWSLEVSSAGIDRPLTRTKDWERFAGHLAKAELDIPVDGRKRFTGIVLGARGDNALLRLDDGTEAALPFARIRKARLILTDALIEASAALNGLPPPSDADVGAAGDEPAPDAPAEGAARRRPPRLDKPKPGGPGSAGSRAGGKAGTRH